MMMRDSWIYRGRGPVSWVLLGFFGVATTVSAQAQLAPLGSPPAFPPSLTGATSAPTPPPMVRPPSAPGTNAVAKVSSGLALTESAKTMSVSLNFKDETLDNIIQWIENLVGRTAIKSPGVGDVKVTIKSKIPLNGEEQLQALEAVLAMNKITLVPMGEKFFKVVAIDAARTHGGMGIGLTPPEAGFNDDDRLISQVVQLKYVEFADVQPVLESLKREYGKIQALERTHSLLITDTQSNIRRMLEILEYLDQPAEAQVETRIYELRYAEAAAVAGRLNDLIAESQSKEEKPRVEAAAPATPAAPTPPGVIRAPRTTTAPGSGNVSEQAERGIIRGKVKIIADERTNIMFVISRPENFLFFDKIVSVLDRPIEAEIGVRVVPLEYAKAEDIAGILNEFIGAASADKNAKGTAANAPGGAPGATGEQRSTELRNFLVQQAESRLAAAQTQLQQREDGKGTIGRLSDKTKILADKRTNSLLLMGRKSDLEALELVLDSLDIMLAQVLIETVILEVNLSDTVETGFDWLQRSMVGYGTQTVGPGGLLVRTPVFSFGGGSVMNSGNFRAGDQVTRDNTGQNSGALTYYATFNDLNLDMIIKMAGQSGDARVLSTPVVLTTDNTEAKIVAAEQRPVVTSTSLQTTGQQTQNFEYRNIGINIKVTPRINPSGFVMMEIEQSADEVLSETTINNTAVPIIGKRELSAQVGVQSRQSVVLGGLVRTDKSKTRTKVPVLGDIPLLGYFFRSDVKRNNRTELMVLLTPYVLKTPQEAMDETHRLYSNSQNAETAWHTGWSDSPLPRMKNEGRGHNSQPDAKEEEKQAHGRMQRQTLLDTLRNKGETNVTPAQSQALIEPKDETLPVTAPKVVPVAPPPSPSSAEDVAPPPEKTAPQKPAPAKSGD